MKSQLICLIAIFILTSACSEEILDSTSSNDQPLSDNVTNNTQNESSSSSTDDCGDTAQLDSSRGACTEELPWQSQVTINTDNEITTITTNGIPDHQVGLFGNSVGSLNPNAISQQSATYRISSQPEIADRASLLLDPNTGPQYSFGVMLNGVQIDPEAAEPWPHTRPVNFNTANFAWNLDAMSINLGLDCNNAHVQPSGKYHYHGSPTLYLEQLNISNSRMTLIGYAADGFPLYYKYGYEESNSSNSMIKELRSSYQLKSGERPGDGASAPCGEYTGIYTADYQYIEGLGDLDECNGRNGVTPEYPNGTYYYVITDSYPYVGRCLVGTPSSDFRLR